MPGIELKAEQKRLQAGQLGVASRGKGWVNRSGIYIFRGSIRQPHWLEHAAG